MPTEQIPPQRPGAEQLAAYVDGELNPAAARAVEAWLALHPEDRAETEAQRRLARLWQATLAPEPAADAWTALRTRIDQGLAEDSPARAGSGSAARRAWPARTILLTLASLATAAAVLVAVWLRPGPAPVEPPPVAPFPVATADDVEVISIRAADVPALVVGRPPVTGPLILASAGDVTVHDSGNDVEIIDPQENPEGPATPWIWGTRDPGPGKEP